ncbi:hypothetical protein ACN6MY_13200 [Peribacillus sp. B-H-3]|uniref:hypothetical protein n=1 Tax=Peribacillus sp. B-H-3 TaxID=3400420 RepID=UPI003B017796
MKKISMIFLAVLMVSVFTACSGAGSDASSTETKKETDTTEKVKKKSANDASKDENIPGLTDPDEKEKFKTYTASLSKNLKGLADNLSTLAELNKNAIENPSITKTEAWKTTAETNHKNMEQLIQNIRLAKSPSITQDVQDKLFLSMDEYQFANDNYLKAFSKMDTSLIEAFTIHMNKGQEYLNQALDKLKALTK